MIWDWRHPIIDNLARDFGLDRFKTVIDLGCGDMYFKLALAADRYVGIGISDDETVCDEKTGVCYKSSNKFDMELDLDRDTLPFNAGEFELVIASQIIEHIPRMDSLCKEISRIAGKAIFIGLPNDLVWDKRLLALFGVNPIGILEHQHCRLFDANNAKTFIDTRFPDWDIEKRLSVYVTRGQRFLSWSGKKRLASLRPNLLSSEEYYLLVKKPVKREAKNGNT